MASLVNTILKLYTDQVQEKKIPIISLAVVRNNLVLFLELEPDLNSIGEYLSRRTIDRPSSSVAQAVNIRAKSYRMHKGDLHQRKAKRLWFVPG